MVSMNGVSTHAVSYRKAILFLHNDRTSERLDDRVRNMHTNNASLMYPVFKWPAHYQPNEFWIYVS